MDWNSHLKYMYNAYLDRNAEEYELKYIYKHFIL